MSGRRARAGRRRCQPSPLPAVAANVQPLQMFSSLLSTLKEGLAEFNEQLNEDTTELRQNAL